MGRDRAPLGRLAPAEAELGASAGQVVPGGPQSPRRPPEVRRLPEASGGPRGREAPGGAQAAGPVGRGAGRRNLENHFPNKKRNLLNWPLVKNLTQNPTY